MSEFRTILQNKKKKIKTSYSKDVLIFLFCILLSTAFWFLHSLSKTNEVELVIPIEYENFPTKYVVTDSVYQSIKVKVKDTGFSILMYELNNNKKSIVVDFNKCSSNNKDELYIFSKELKKKVRKATSSTMSIRSIEPQHIKIHYEKLYEKVVPLKLNGDITLSHLHILKDSITLKPSRIKIFGSKSMLNSIHVVNTKKVDLKKISQSTKVITSPEEISNIRFATNKIQVTIPVELYTEKTFTIPVTTKNLPLNTQIKTFPTTVNVSFVVGLSHFNKIQPEEIQAFIDYDSITNNKDGRPTIEIRTSLKSIKNLNHTPKTVEYILEKK